MTDDKSSSTNKPSDSKPPFEIYGNVVRYIDKNDNLHIIGARLDRTHLHDSYIKYYDGVDEEVYKLTPDGYVPFSYINNTYSVPHHILEKIFEHEENVDFIYKLMKARPQDMEIYDDEKVVFSLINDFKKTVFNTIKDKRTGKVFTQSNREKSILDSLIGPEIIANTIFKSHPNVINRETFLRDKFLDLHPNGLKHTPYQKGFL